VLQRRASLLWEEDREAEQLIVAFGNDSAALSDLFERQLDRIGMSQQRFAVLFPYQRSTALQLFERVALGRKRESEGRMCGHPQILPAAAANIAAA
jgi:hypothetical protein